MTELEQAMYGMSKTDIASQFKWSIDMMGAEMTAISLLSDAQEVMARGDVERARKWINVAKFILVEQMEAKRNG